MKILSWNVNGYRAILNKGFKDYIGAAGADIIGLQEVKAEPAQLKPEDMAFDGYKSLWNPAERKGYSGVAVFFKQAPITNNCGMGQPKYDAEGRILQLEYKDFYFLNIYFPNGGGGPERLQYKLEFYDAFFAHIEKLRKTGKPVIFCGDVNTAHKPLDLARPKENETRSGFLPIERAWLDKITEAGWVDTFRLYNKEGGHYSWWDYKTGARARNVGWRLDYFFINSEAQKLIKNAFIINDIQGSDHCPVGIDLVL